MTMTRVLHRCHVRPTKYGLIIEPIRRRHFKKFHDHLHYSRPRDNHSPAIPIARSHPTFYSDARRGVLLVTHRLSLSMHHALLIDELLRQIFSIISEDGSEPLATFARICKAWTDPALDFVWMRLISVVPLLDVIPGVQLVDGIYAIENLSARRDMSRFQFYAGRVKHIAHRRSVQVHPDLLFFLTDYHRNSFSQHTPILPILRTAQIYSTCNAFQAALSLSGELRHIQLDLGFKPKAAPLSNDILLHYLDQVTRFSHDLEAISIRGSATKCLNAAISSLQNVKVLSLCLGITLATDTLLAVTTFPRLVEFEVHASHFGVEELGEHFHNRQPPIFPSLQNLHVRAHTPVIELFLHALPNDSLHTLCMEVEDLTCSTVSWATIFNLICTKSANTLRNLTIAHHAEIDYLELESNNSTSAHPIADQDIFVDDRKFNVHIPFTDLRILGGLHHIRRFILDTSLPAGICDHELELVLAWWQELEHLDLGFIHHTNPPAQRWLSSRSLVIIAKQSRKLANLILPVDISCADNAPMIDLPRQPVLARLTCGYPFPTTHTPIEVAEYLHRLFPSLQTVDGLWQDGDQWSQTQTALRS